VLPAVDGVKPVPRSGCGPRLIYVVGGVGEGNVRLSKVELYDPQNPSWKQLASMAGPRSGHGCAALEGKLYAVGGNGGTGRGLDTAEVYDPQTDGWQPLANMTTVRSFFSLGAVGGKIYAIGGWGGWGGDSTLESVEAYDPQLGSWALVASMSVQRIGHASVVLDGKIYSMGGLGDGTDGDSILKTVEVYDPQANSWLRVASMPQGRARHAVAAMGGKIYVTGGTRNGGENQGDTLNSACVYDPQADAWTQLPSMSIARDSHASAAVGGKLYVFGGVNYSGTGYLGTVEVYDPASDSWVVQGPSLTCARIDIAAVAL